MHVSAAASVTNPFDHDRDGRVDARDLLLTRMAWGNSLPAPPAQAARRREAGVIGEVLGL